MPRFTDAFLERLRSVADIRDVAGDYVDQLTPAGADRLKACCPLPQHQEKTPSFHIRPSMHVWHCFGCQAGGDIVDLVRQVENLDFVGAVDVLAGRYGLAVDYEDASTDTSAVQRTVIRSVLAAAHAHYRDSLRADSPEVRDVLGWFTGPKRRFTTAHLDEWEIGYAPQWRTDTYGALRATFSTQQLVDAGLVIDSDRGTPFDRFRGRIMWPLQDSHGNLVGFAGRVVGNADGNKYLNSPEGPVFHKSQIIFGLHRARRAVLSNRQFVVVEGYTDVMALHAAGITNAGATAGTAFTADHAQKISALVGRAGEIVLMFDDDDAGHKAAWRVFVACQDLASVSIAPLPDGHDPCSLRAVHGDDALRTAHAHRQPALRVILRWVAAQHDLSVPEQKAAATRAVAERLASVTDPVLRREYVPIAAAELGVHVSDVARLLPRELATSPRTTPPRQADTAVFPSQQISEVHERLLSAAITDTQLLARLIAAQTDVPELLPAELTPILHLVQSAASTAQQQSQSVAHTVAERIQGVDEATRRFVTRLLAAEALDATEFESLLVAAVYRGVKQRRDRLANDIRSVTDPSQQLSLLQRIDELDRRLNPPSRS